MKKMTILCVVILVASLTLVAVASCAAPAPEPSPLVPLPPAPPVPVAPTPPAPLPAPAPSPEITLADAPQVLDLLPLLPASFEKVDAASEGMSKEDMGIYDPSVSEVELFLAEEPFQMIYCFLSIIESRIEQASFDASIKDEQQIESLVIENLKLGALEEGYELEVPQVQITYPGIADSSVLAEGQMAITGFTMGFDTLWFRQESVYVFIYSSYMSPERQPLVPIAEAIEQRIAQYPQVIVPAPVPTPPPPTPEISKEVLYSDDFSNETSGWDTYEDEDGSTFYYDEEFHLKPNTFAEYDVVSYYTHQIFTDFVLEVETRLVDGADDNSQQVLVRVQSTEEPNYYGFAISADGYYGVAKVVNGELIELFSMTRSIHVLKGKDAVNLMRVECVGSNLRLSVNGYLLAEVTDSSFASGFLGFAGTAWTEQHGKTFSEIAFDNLVVTSP